MRISTDSINESLRHKRHVIMNRSIHAILMLIIFPIALNAENDFLEDKLPSIVKNIAEGAENGDSGEVRQKDRGLQS